MIKKAKRFIDNLSSKQTYQLICCICVLVTLLISLLCIVKKIDFVVILITVFAIPYFLYYPLSFIFNLFEKEMDEELKRNRIELEKFLTDSNGTIKLSISDSTTEFPKELILFYLEQKGSEFYFELMESNKDDTPIGKIFITDKDNPDKKIEYPEPITQPYNLKDFFEFKK